MKISEVRTSADAEQFLSLPGKIYMNDPNWIQPLNKDIIQVFDPKQNKFFRHGECTRFLLWSEKGEVIGRIAAFINKRTANKEKQPTGGSGFFECIDDQTAANLLFDAARDWLKARGMEAMDGPINFGERDSWWGLIVEGFSPPPYKMNYNPPYYQSLFENYGFKNYFEQWCYSLKVRSKLQDKFYERHAKLASNPDYRVEHIRKNQLDKYAEDFRIVYNKAWGKHGAGKELESKQVQMFFSKMKPVIDEKLIWYVYHKDEPVAAWINLPDINQIFKLFRGKFGLLEKIRFFFLLRKKVSQKIIGLVFGIVPEHQGKGVDSYMIVEGAKVIQNHTDYLDFEMQWVGDFNPKMVSIAQSLGTYKSRTLVTYRYLFDRNIPFSRHPVL
ncbi:MAG: hypothetical protein DWQ44_08205 [Bacteroidetes bacterium]|nr:MAG: hypothetical protein DWQ33_01605 [Bacteroidota bacterium]REK07034.1 MAG: hypothetical protein DWQ39_02485 [Bacteroidota bacterium]REK33619.1 MAG: hypothetical protein DWQ44_08205 [Bacteroidota bacterium]REK48604.1 MAG: hypothetical protein DWQ48_09640 [Bacteroidota bacterium]